MSSELGKTYIIRDFKKEDEAFVYATWLRGLYYGDTWFSEIEKNIFMENYKKIISAILSRSTVKVACLVEDQDVVLGYSVLSNDFSVLHWVFVKLAFRKQGIAASLCPAHPACVTHLTPLGRDLLPKLSGAIFNPFALG